MGPVADTIHRIRRRLLLEVLDLDPVPEPQPPKAEWPEWSTGGDSSPVRLRVLSLNAWGLPVAPKCTERAVEIANAIHDKYEIVVLQEIWHRRERDIIINRVAEKGFHYYHYFQPAVGFPVPFGPNSFGTGLLVLSKYPLLGAMYHSFSLTGRPYALHEADFIANKGVGLLRVQTPHDQVDLYVTHLLANYNHLGQPGPGDRYLAHRVSQSYELERFIEATSRNAFTLVCGDFNSPSDCMVLRIPRELRQLRDAFTDMNNHDGLTFAAEDNKFSHGEHPMRMDYILYKIARCNQVKQRSNSAEPAPGWHLVASDVFKAFFTDEKGDKYPLSDHFGVTAEFVFAAKTPLDPCDASGDEPSGADCATTTCIQCDTVKLDNENASDQIDAAGHTVITRCLDDLQATLHEGRLVAMDRRVAHLRRSAQTLFVLLVLMTIHLSLIDLSQWVWVAALLLLLHVVVEYTLAFFVVGLEVSTFTELVSEVRLHQQTEAVLAQRAAAL